MCKMNWLGPYAWTACATEPPTSSSLTYTIHRVITWAFSHTPAAANNWMEAVLTIPLWVDLNLPLMWRIYGTSYETEDVNYHIVMGVNLSSTPIAGTNNPTLGTWSKMTLNMRAINTVWGGDSADSSPWLKAKEVTIAGSPAAGNLLFIQCKRFNQDAADNFDHTFYVLGVRLWAAVRDKYDLYDWETI